MADPCNGCTVARGGLVSLDGTPIGRVFKVRSGRETRWIARNLHEEWVSEGVRRRDAVDGLLGYHRACLVSEVHDAARRLRWLAPPNADRSNFHAVERLACGGNLEACRAYLYEGAELLGLVPRIRRWPPQIPAHLRELWLIADELRIVAPIEGLRWRARHVLLDLGPPYDRLDKVPTSAAYLVAFMRGANFWVPQEEPLLESYLAMLCEELEGELGKLAREGVADAVAR